MAAGDGTDGMEVGAGDTRVGTGDLVGDAAVGVGGGDSAGDGGVQDGPPGVPSGRGRRTITLRGLIIRRCMGMLRQRRTCSIRTRRNQFGEQAA
jgi:hypothetical protein